MFNDKISRKKILSAVSMYLIFSILQRGKSRCFFKLPAEMFRIVISAVYSDKVYRLIAVCKKVFGVLYAAFYNILHKGSAESHFI